MITKNRAQKFYDEMKKKVYPPDGIWKLAQVKIGPKMVSEYMGITETEAKDYIDAIVRYELSVSEGGGFLVV